MEKAKLFVYAIRSLNIQFGRIMFRLLLCVVRHRFSPMRCVDKRRYIATTIALDLRMCRSLFFAYAAALPKSHPYPHQHR